MEFAFNNDDESLASLAFENEEVQPKDSLELHKYLNSSRLQRSLKRPTITRINSYNRKLSNEESLLKEAEYTSSTSQKKYEIAQPTLNNIFDTKLEPEVDYQKRKRNKYSASANKRTPKMPDVNSQTQTQNMNRIPANATSRIINNASNMITGVKVVRENLRINMKDSANTDFLNEVKNNGSINVIYQLESPLKLTPNEEVNIFEINELPSQKNILNSKLKSNRNNGLVKEAQNTLSNIIRRKSCHCSDCGGLSKFERRHLDVINSPIDKTAAKLGQADDAINWQKSTLINYTSLMDSSVSMESIEDASSKTQRLKIKLDEVIEESNKDFKASKPKNISCELSSVDINKLKKSSTPQSYMKALLSSYRPLSKNQVHSGATTARDERQSQIPREAVNCARMRRDVINANKNSFRDGKNVDSKITDRAVKITLKHRNKYKPSQDLRKSKSGFINSNDKFDAVDSRFAFKQIKRDDASMTRSKLFPAIDSSTKGFKLMNSAERKKSKERSIKQIYANEGLARSTYKLPVREMVNFGRVHTSPNRPNTERSISPLTSARRTNSSKRQMRSSNYQGSTQMMIMNSTGYVLTSRFGEAYEKSTIKNNWNASSNIEAKVNPAKILDVAALRSSAIHSPFKKTGLSARMIYLK